MEYHTILQNLFHIKCKLFQVMALLFDIINHDFKSVVYYLM